MERGKIFKCKTLLKYIFMLQEFEYGKAIAVCWIKRLYKMKQDISTGVEWKEIFHNVDKDSVLH